MERSRKAAVLRRFSSPLLRLGTVGLVLPAPTSMAAAQNNTPPIKGMASTVGLYVYPKNHQTATQQLTERATSPFPAASSK